MVESDGNVFKPWLSVQNGVLAVAVVYVFVLLVRLNDLSSSDVASWVQAIGAIASIWGAFAISNSQLKKAEDRDRRVRAEKIDAYVQVRRTAVLAAKAVRESVLKKPSPEDFKAGWEAHEGGHLRASLDALEMIPVHELGTTANISAHLFVASALKNMHSATEQAISSDWFFTNPEVLYENIDALYQFQDMNVKNAMVSTLL